MIYLQFSSVIGVRIQQSTVRRFVRLQQWLTREECLRHTQLTWHQTLPVGLTHLCHLHHLVDKQSVKGRCKQIQLTKQKSHAFFTHRGNVIKSLYDTSVLEYTKTHSFFNINYWFYKWE